MVEYRMRTKCITCGNRSAYSQGIEFIPSDKKYLFGFENMKYCSTLCHENSEEMGKKQYEREMNLPDWLAKLLNKYDKYASKKFGFLKK